MLGGLAAILELLDLAMAAAAQRSKVVVGVGEVGVSGEREYVVDVLGGLGAEGMIPERVAAQRIGDAEVEADFLPEPVAANLLGDSERGVILTPTVVVPHVGGASGLADNGEGVATGLNTRFWRGFGHQGVSGYRLGLKTGISAGFCKVGGGAGKSVRSFSRKRVRVMWCAEAQASRWARWAFDRRKFVMILGWSIWRICAFPLHM